MQIEVFYRGNAGKNSDLPIWPSFCATPITLIYIGLDEYGKRRRRRGKQQ